MNELLEVLLQEATDIADAEELNFLDYDDRVTQVFAGLIVKEMLDTISAEQDKAEQNWQCEDGIHITHKLKSMFEI